MYKDVSSRLNQLTSLQNYHKDVDTEVTMILQNLQWDRKHLIERKPSLVCQYDTSHRVPPDKLLKHEEECLLKSYGYTKEDRFLPSPVDPDALTLVKLCAENIADIINNDSYCQTLYRTGVGSSGHQPLTLERLQATYTASERLAIHNAVVNQVPSCHDLSDLAFVRWQDDVGKETKIKSKLEILAELRDMRRRRTKYRVAPKTRNYSDVLRDVIFSQMELYQAHNSTAQMQTAITNSSNVSNISNKSYHSTREEITNSVKDKSNISRNSPVNGRSEIGKTMQVDSYSTSRLRSPTKTEQHKYNFDSKSKRRDNFQRSHKEKRKDYDHYESRIRHDEVEYHCRGKMDKHHERQHDYKKYQSHQRHYSHGERKNHDQYGSSKRSPKNSDKEDRRKRYEYKRKQEETVVIKKEKDGTDDYSHGSNVSENNTEVTSHRYKRHNSDVKKYGEVYVKKEEDVNFSSMHCGSKSSSMVNQYKKSNKYTQKSSTYKDRHNYRTSYNSIQQERNETPILRIKEEKDIMYDNQIDKVDNLPYKDNIDIRHTP